MGACHESMRPEFASQQRGSRILAHTCNPATWRSKIEKRRMSSIEHYLMSKSCLINTHPVALPPNILGRVASGKGVVITQLQASGIKMIKIFKYGVYLGCINLIYTRQANVRRAG